MASGQLLVLLALVVVATVLVMGRTRPCLTDADCKYDKCCVSNFTGQGKICRGLPEHIGDACGGDYFCSTCAYNLVCTPLVQLDPVVANDTATEVTSTCPPPANATCQMPEPVDPIYYTDEL